MSEVREPTTLERAAWVKRVLKIEIRKKAIGGAIEREISRAQPEDPEDAPKDRKALAKGLTQLKQRAIEFAGIAPAGQYSAVRGDIRSIEKLIGQSKWEEAHDKITQVHKHIAETAPSCRALANLQKEIQRVTLKLDKAAPFLLPDDLQLYEKLLLGLENTGLDAVEKGADTLRKAESDIDWLAKEGEARLGRIETLQKKRLLAETATTRLAEHAGDLALTDLQGRANTLATRLSDLATSKDEKALTEAVEEAGKLAKESEQPFAEAEFKLRQEQLADLGERMNRLLAGEKALLDNAVASLLLDVASAKNDLVEQLKKEPETESVVIQAEAAFGGLVSAIDDLREAMRPVQKWQTLMQARLEKYKPLKEKDRLDNAYDALPKELKEGIGTAKWLKAESWLEPKEYNPWEFLSAWAARLAQDTAALERENYDDAIAQQTSVCGPFAQIRKQASPAHRTQGDDLVNQISVLLAGGQDSKRLTKDDKEEIDDFFEKLDALVTEANSNISAKKDKANQIDSGDGGHSVKRHGPEITDAKLQSRLTTGRAPDGVFSPAAKSCRFNSYDDLIDTRAIAFQAIATGEATTVAALFGNDFDRPPGPGEDTFYQITKDHAPREIGGGFRGRPPAHPFPTSGQRFDNVEPMPALTRTFTKVSWNATKSRWVAVQHFPTDV